MTDEQATTQEPTVIDMRCTCDRCEAGTQETYRLAATCGNCQSEHVALIRKGDQPIRSAACPTCGVSWKLMFGGLVQ